MASMDVPTETAELAEDYPALRSRKLRLLIPAIVAVGFMMEQLDSTIITTAIPDIAQSLQVTPLQMNLAITSYILSLAVFIPISGWIADRYGSRRVFAAAMLIFTIGSMLCGLADTLPMMVATRVLQGFGGAMMTPVGRLVLIRAFPRNQLVTAMTYMTVPALIGPTIGPLLGGFITMYANWRWIFYVNVPIGLIGFVLVLRYVDDVRLKKPAQFDAKGFLIAGLSLALLQLTLENVGHPMIGHVATAGLFVASMALMYGYARYARHVADPALDLSLFSIRSFRISTMAGGLSRIGVNAVPFMLPLLFQIGFGLTPLQSGSLTFITSLGALLTRPISSWLLRTVGFRGMLIGNGTVCAAVTAAFALVQASTPHWQVFLLVMFFGVVRSVQFMTSNTLTYADTPASKLSRSTSLGGVIQQLTVSFGVSIGAALLGIIAGPGNLPTVPEFHLAFIVVALIILASCPGFLPLRPEDGAQVSGYKRPGVAAQRSA